MSCFRAGDIKGIVGGHGMIVSWNEIGKVNITSIGEIMGHEISVSWSKVKNNGLFISDEKEEMID